MEALQGWVALSALVVSSLGLVLAHAAFKDQASSNHSQTAMNEEETRRARRQDASKVNWRDAAKGKNVVEIVNRSSELIEDVILVVSLAGTRFWWAILNPARC
jgi:hypothetical protein